MLTDYNAAMREAMNPYRRNVPGECALWCWRIPAPWWQRRRRSWTWWALDAAWPSIGSNCRWWPDALRLSRPWTRWCKERRKLQEIPIHFSFGNRWRSDFFLPMLSGTEFQWKSCSLETLSSFSFWKWHVSEQTRNKKKWISSSINLTMGALAMNYCWRRGGVLVLRLRRRR